MSRSRTQGASVGGTGRTAGTAPEPAFVQAYGAPGEVVPRLLAFYVDEFIDGDDFASGYRTVGYGIRWRDGTCVTVCESSPGSPPSVTIWPSVIEASRRLGAHVSGLTPRRSIDDRSAAVCSHDEGPAATGGGPAS